MSSKYPPLHWDERVVTHAPMTTLFRLAIIGAIIFAFFLYTESENREAIRTADSGRCWSLFYGSSCHSKIAMDAANRL